MQSFSSIISLLFLGVCCLLPMFATAAPKPRLLVSTPPANRKILSFKKPDGSWGRKSSGNWELCPGTSRAIGFAIKREPFQGGILDETSINGVKLVCNDVSQTEITGDVGSWGSWSPIRKCCESKMAYLSAFSMAYDDVYSPSTTSTIDDAGVDEIDFKCKSDQKNYLKWEQKFRGVEGPVYGSLNRNLWTGWGDSCETGICGIRTYVDLREVKPFFPPLSDHNGLHNVELLCCGNK